MWSEIDKARPPPVSTYDPFAIPTKKTDADNARLSFNFRRLINVARVQVKVLKKEVRVMPPKIVQSNNWYARISFSDHAPVFQRLLGTTHLLLSCQCQLARFKKSALASPKLDSVIRGVQC
jgi:hypothetical protein